MFQITRQLVCHFFRHDYIECVHRLSSLELSQIDIQNRFYGG